jgi:hypothetical protein
VLKKKSDRLPAGKLFPIRGKGLPLGRDPETQRVSPARARCCRQGEEPVACFLEAVGDGPALQAPFAQKRLALLLDPGRAVGADHVPAVFGQPVVHVLRGMGRTVSVPVNPAAPDRQVVAPQRHKRGFQPRGAVDDHEFGPFQAPGIKIIEELPPGCGALPAHIPDG